MTPLTKAHNRGYAKKNGTFVAPFNDKRPPAKPKQPSLFGKPSWPPTIGEKQLEKPKKPPAWHPKADEDGKGVPIWKPTTPTASSTWTDPQAVATFTPGGDVPASLHGVSFTAWKDHPRTDEGWDYVEGQMDDLEEPALKVPAGKKVASGVIVEEPDGRVWLVHPTNQFAGYDATFPKGGAEDGLSLQANAIKEAFEESGLKVQITGLVGDFQRGLSVARYYRAVRVGGTPTAMGWESQAVSLVPKAQMLALLNGEADTPIAHAVGAPEEPGVKPVDIKGWKQTGAQAGSNEGGFYTAPGGQEWYCKFPKTPDHAKNENLASKLYEAAGIRVPSMMLVTRGGQVGVASKVIPVLVKDKQALISGEAKGAREGFAVDAWLCNHDVVGAVYDNLMVDAQEHAVRLDPGGALIFRAQGEPKGALFGPTANEIATMRDPKIAPQAAPVFAGVTDADIRAGVEKIAAIDDAKIRDLVTEFGPGKLKERLRLADTLIARKNDLIARFMPQS